MAGDPTLYEKPCCGGLAGCGNSDCSRWREAKRRERVNMNPLVVDNPRLQWDHSAAALTDQSLNVTIDQIQGFVRGMAAKIGDPLASRYGMGPYDMSEAEPERGSIFDPPSPPVEHAMQFVTWMPDDRTMKWKYAGCGHVSSLRVEDFPPGAKTIDPGPCVQCGITWGTASEAEKSRTIDLLAQSNDLLAQSNERMNDIPWRTGAGQSMQEGMQSQTERMISNMETQMFGGMSAVNAPIVIKNLTPEEQAELLRVMQSYSGPDNTYNEIKAIAPPSVEIRHSLETMQVLRDELDAAKRYVTDVRQQDLANRAHRLRMFAEGVISDTAIEDLIISRAEVMALGWEYKPMNGVWVKPQAVQEPGIHDYHGPTKPVLDNEGNPTKDRIPVPDQVHEQFHRAVGDVIAGKVLPAAREQMRRELDRAPAHAPTTASTSKPMPDKAIGFGPQEIGLRLP